jgi:Domain of unknown function (DUF1844)
MSEDEKPVTKPFTVSDRRHFAVEGSTEESRGAEPEAAEPAETAGVAERGEPPAEIDLAGFMMSLGMQAGALLEGAHEGEQGAREALPAARSIISILEMLQKKTQGNRTDEETRILDSLLYELRLGYVEATRVVGS